MKSIKCLFFILLGLGIGIVVSRRESLKLLTKLQDDLKKNVCLFGLTNEWLADRQKGKNIGDVLRNKGYQSVAVYGMGYLGERLVDELSDSGINIQYTIDRSKKKRYADIDIRGMQEDLPEVDVVVVTAICDFEEIKSSLKEKIKSPIISLEDIIYG